MEIAVKIDIMKVMFMHENHLNTKKKKKKKVGNSDNSLCKDISNFQPLYPLTLSFQRITMHSKCTSRIGTRGKVNFISVSTIKSLRCQQFEHDRFISFRISRKPLYLSPSFEKMNLFPIWVTIYIIVPIF